MDLTPLQYALSDEDPDKAAGDVRRARKSNPDCSDDEIAGKLVARAALRGTLVGAAASAPPSLLGGFAAAADYTYQARSLNRLVLAVAKAYGRPVTPLERFAAAAAGLAFAGATEWARRESVRAARRAFSRRPPVFSAIAAAAASGAASYAAVRLVGLLAREAFGDRRRRGSWWR